MIELAGIRFELLVPPPWTRSPDDDVARWTHPSGLQLTVKHRDGERGRFEATVIPTDDIATAPAPRVHVTSDHPLIPWLAGGSAEIVAPTSDGPIWGSQRRGYAVGTLQDMGLFAEPLVVAPGHPQTSVWVFERLPGDLLDVPGAPAWLPERLHVPHGDEIELQLPDGIVTGVSHTEVDDGFVLMDEPGLHIAEVGGPTGITRLEVGWSRDWHELVADARTSAPDDLWCHLSTLLHEVDVDEFDIRLGRALETPTLWSALAAWQAVDHGIVRVDDAREAAAIVARDADVPTRVALVSRGLIDVESLVGVQLGREAYEALLRFGLGHAMSSYPDGAERGLASVWFWLAGLGDSQLGARVGGIAAQAQARALCRASDTLDPEAVAWLSLFA